jgi:hypothetical protein
MRKIFFINFFFFSTLSFLLISTGSAYSAPSDNSVWCDSACNTTQINCNPGYNVPLGCRERPTNCCYTLYPGGACPQFIPCVLSTVSSPTPTSRPPTPTIIPPTATPRSSPTPTTLKATPGSCTTYGFTCHWEGSVYGCQPYEDLGLHCGLGWQADAKICNQWNNDEDNCRGQYNNCCVEITPGSCYKCEGLECIPVESCASPDKEYDDWGSCYLACTGQIPPSPEEYGNCSYHGVAGVKTALGCIPTQDTQEFVGWILRLAIGIGGGIAFLLMLFGGIKMITSAGNPEAVKAGQELITSALMGLIFIIFSLFLLQLIGVKIFEIPGFGE